MTKIEHTIKIKGGKEEKFSVYSTHHGPVFMGIDPFALNAIA